MPIVELLSVLARLVVGVMLVTAGLAKLGAADEFARTLGQFPLPRFLRDSHLRRRSAGRALAATEVAVGTCFALGLGLTAAGLLALGLLIGFSAELAVALARGRNAPCGCFGHARRQTTRLQALARNGVMALLVVAGMQSAALSLDAVEGALAAEQVAAVLAALGAALLSWALLAKGGAPGLQLRPALAGDAPGVVFARGKTKGNARQAKSRERPSRKAPQRKPARSADDPAAKLAELYKAAVDAERQGTALTLQLDRRKIAAPPPPSEGAPKRRRKTAWEKEEAELVKKDESLGRDIQRLYKAAAAIEAPNADRELVRTALLHWTMLLRRRAMEGFHTAVAGLEDDPDCSGDLIGDELLLVYFDALFRDPKKLKRELEDERATTQHEAVLALAEIARQTACLGAQQSALLASHLYWSFVQLIGFLRLNELERIVPYVVQAAVQPMLLFYDVEKHRGPYSPLARWFAEYQATLAAGIETRRMPASWHGLWLYDWRSGHMVGYRITDDPRDENDINGQLFFGSITRPENLGKYDCSFSEMAERGPGRGGYFCAGSSCDEKGALPRGSVGAKERQGGLAGWLQGTFRLRNVASSAARFGEPGGMLKDTACSESIDGGGRGGSGRCDGGLEAAGRTRESEMVRCLSERVTSPADQMMSCMGEGTGRCADPVGKLAKELQETNYAGVKLGRDCGLKEEAGDKDGGEAASNGKGTKQQKTEAEKKFEEALKKLEKEAKEADQAKQELDKAQEEANKLPELEKQKEEAEKKKEEAANKKEADPSDKNWDDYIAAQKAAEEAAAKVEAVKANLEAAKLKEINERHERTKALDNAQKAYDETKQADNKRCPPDTPDCGGNECTGMADAMKQMMDCTAKLLDPQAGGPGGPAPEWPPGQDPVVDPSPEEPGDVKMHPCFEMLGEEGAAPGINTSKGCWVFDCGPEQNTAGTPAGGCTCVQPEAMGSPGGALAGNCANVYCAEGSPRFRNGHCTCSDDEPAGEAGAVKKAEFEVPKPLSFSTVHVTQFGQDWRQSSSAGTPGAPGYPPAGTYP